ncbi:hypothetical protein P3X46_032185 [Hevea brasiliensis]|uniref:Aspartic peptidase DDI1-type domain-containing protein n=1 Tax=Hevea brasiliensis TaxID=3981 RepID=A0ABQ9KDZ2_HEVBR|nr:hypothetical protein P3X46_032185 [Hevea brasiliensis]
MKKKKQGEKESEVPKVEVNTEPKLNKINNYVLPPFLCRLAKTKKEEQEIEILETFRKVEVNIPLLDAIKQVPKYAKFLKELCTTKRKLRNNEKISVGENVSALIQQKLPPKCKDPGSFSIPCRIGDSKFERAMADLGASINVMSNSIFQTLNLGPLKETSVIIQLAYCSNAYQLGVFEDVLVQVGELIFPADFYILDMEDSVPTSKLALILFGRPFLKTAKTKIDVNDGTLTMEFDGETVKFNIFDAMKYPADDHSIFSIDVVQDAVMALQSLPPVPKRYGVLKIDLPISHTKLLPSAMQAPVLELKPLPEHLKYVYLGDNETLPVIISSNLTKDSRRQID